MKWAISPEASLKHVRFLVRLRPVPCHEFAFRLKLVTVPPRPRPVPPTQGYDIEMAHAHNSTHNMSNRKRLRAHGLSTLTIITHVRLFEAMRSRWHKHIIQNIKH